MFWCDYQSVEISVYWKILSGRDAGMCHDPDRTGSGRGPGARSTLCYSKVWAWILNLWNTPGLRAPFTPHLTPYLPYSKFLDTTTSSTCTPSPVSQDWTRHIHFNVVIAIPPSSPVHNLWSTLFPTHVIQYNAIILYPKDTWCVTIWQAHQRVWCSYFTLTTY